MFKQLSSNQIEMVKVFLNGRPLQVPKGISVAAVALSQNLSFTRTTPVTGSKRAPFCMMGACYDCLMIINGKANQQACATYVQDGMQIDIQQGVGPEMEIIDSE
ncbi:MAG: (2Fe-2S)-binding protein [Methyloprofundus sp.]|nr:(2Fe-2S)-binding protein [Methyloprofundus sp.]